MIQYPDYKNSLLSVTTSILKHYGIGGSKAYSSLPLLDEKLQKSYKNVVLLVLDGMGMHILENNLPPHSFLRQHLCTEISSVFPPTTTAATTTLESGLPPIAHGWLGWSLYFEEVEQNVNIFINTNDEGERVAPWHVAGRYLPYKPIIEQINETGKVKCESISPFGTYPVKTFKKLCHAIQSLCEDDEKRYLYAYWPEPDGTMHRKGCFNREAKRVIIAIDRQLEKLSEGLKDTLLIITADHGHMDGEPKLLQDYPDIIETLKRLPSIEPRALSFFVKEGMEEAFKEAFEKHFGQDFLLLSKAQVLEEKLFGEGEAHPKVESFIGDFMAIGISKVTLFYSRHEYEHFKGVHAGLTKEEMMIPLIVVAND